MATYPPVLPPPDFFDLDLEAEKLKDMFKATNSLKNPLYDETGLVDLPTDDKGILILDPESKTRMVDVEVELDCLYEYLDWITSASGAVDEEGRKWMEGLRREVDGDMGEVFDEWHAVVDEERRKRGLTDRWTHWAHFKGQERKGEGANGEWVIKKVVQENEGEKGGEKAPPVVGVEGVRNVEGVSEPPLIPPALPEETGPSCMAKMVGNGQEATVAVVVEDRAVFEHAEVSSVKPDDRMITAQADTVPKGNSPVPPQLQLVDLWW